MKAVRYASFKFKEKLKTRDTNVRVIKIEMVVKAPVLDEVVRGSECSYREKDL